MYERLTINSIKRQLGLPVFYRRRSLSEEQKAAKATYGRASCGHCGYDYTQIAGMDSTNPAEPWIEAYGCRVRRPCKHCSTRFQNDLAARQHYDALLHEIRMDAESRDISFCCDSP
jgi:hypothetical protein